MNEQFLASMEKDSDAFSTKLRNCPRDELYLITPDYLTPYLSYIKNKSDCSAQQQKMRRCWGWIKAMIGCSVMCLRRFSTATVYYSKIDLISWPFIFGDYGNYLRMAQERLHRFHYVCYRFDSAVCKNSTKRNTERCLTISSLEN